MAGDTPPVSPAQKPAGNGAGPGGMGPAPASKGRADRPPTPPRPPGRPSKNAKRAEHVEKLSARLVKGAVVCMLVDPLTGNAVMRHTPAIAEAAADVAEQYPWAAALLDRSVQGGSLIGLGTAVGFLGLEIAANKGMLPDPLNAMFATPAPDDGESPAPPAGMVSQVGGPGAGTMSEAARQARERLAGYAPQAPAGAP